MISKLINKNSKKISKIDCLEHISEINKKKSIIFSLLREKAVEEYSNSSIDEFKSIIPFLCDAYVSLSRLSEYLSGLVVKYAEKPMIKLDSINVTSCLVLYQCLQNTTSSLKHLYRLNLCAEKELC